MNGKTKEGRERGGPSAQAPGDGGDKKRFEPPQLIEWGSIVDLTRGPKGGKEDFPFGGTRGL